MNEQPPTAVPSTHFRREAEIMRDRHRRLAGGRGAVDVGAYFRSSLTQRKFGQPAKRELLSPSLAEERE
jgi:hypothetical protein